MWSVIETPSKTKQFCETCWLSKLDNIENVAILQEFLAVLTSQHRKRSNSMPGHTKCCTCHAKSSQQTWRSDAPKCSPLRKSAPWPSNFSDEHVSCTAPATENASLQILFKCPTPAIGFGNAAKPLGAQSLAPARWNDTWTSKSVP